MPRPTTGALGQYAGESSCNESLRSSCPDPTGPTRPQNFGKIDRSVPHVEKVKPSDGLQHTVSVCGSAQLVLFAIRNGFWIHGDGNESDLYCL
jgi:hypothetical protein